MANTFQTNSLTDLVALRFLVNVPFLTVGSKGYFKDQLVGKRNGTKYTFVIRDAGVVEGGSTIENGGLTHSAATDVKEASVQMELIPWHIMISTNAVEAVTDVKWDDEIAKPNGGKLAASVAKDAVTSAISNAAVAVIGEGFQPLAEAGAHLESISPDKIFGFIDPRFQAILTTNGQQFQPVGSPDSFYSKGLLGTFHSVEYRSQRYFPTLVIDETLATYLAGASVKASSWDLTNQKFTIANGSSASGTIPKGTPIFVNGVYACDILGMPTDQPFAFVLKEDATIASGEAEVSYEIKVTNFTAQSAAATYSKATGTSLYALANGNIPKAADFEGKTISSLKAGKYILGQLRLDGAYEFETLDKLDASNSESKVGNVEGVTVHENRVVNLDAMTSKTRWDIVAMYGVTDPRAVVNVYGKVV